MSSHQREDDDAGPIRRALIAASVTVIACLVHTEHPNHSACLYYVVLGARKRLPEGIIYTRPSFYSFRSALHPTVQLFVELLTGALSHNSMELHIINSPM